MRSLSPTLLAAQKAASSVPYVQVTVSDRILGVPHPRWERLYGGSEADSYHDATMPGDGSLLRTRVDPAGPALYYQRTDDPGPGGPFGSWTSFGSVAGAGVGLSAAGAKVLLACVASNGIDILVRDSADSGQTFESAQTAVRAAAAVGWVAVALKSDGDALLVYSAGSGVYVSKRVGTSWTLPAAWPYAATTIRGLAVVHSGDYHLAVAAADGTGEAKLWTAIYGDGFGQAVDTWSPLGEVARAESGSSVSLRAPSLAVLDTHRLFFVEEYAGTVAYSRPQWTWFAPSQTFAANAWREPAPFDLASSFGVAITGTSDSAWCSTPFGVWQADLATPTLDVSADVLELNVDSHRSGGMARVVLRNDDGRYSDPAADPSASIRPGSDLAVNPGYVTSAGSETSSGPRYRIDGWEHRTAGGEATFVLHARDAWSLVERWRARRQYTWQAGDRSVLQILRFVLGRAGIELVDAGSSSTASGHKPAFTVHPDEDGLRTAQRLLATVPDVVLNAGEYALIFEPLATDEAAYAYGTDHPIFRGRYSRAGLSANRAQVFGPGVVAEGFDWGDIDDQLDWLRQVHDLNVNSVALAEDRAAATLRQEEMVAARGEIVSPVNCGQELYDVVAVTDPAAGLSAASHRVVGLGIRYVRRGGSAAYEQRLLLGAV